VSILFPIRGRFQWKRVDKGQDFLTRPGTPLVAVVGGTLSDPNGFGPRYPILHGDDGRSYYYGHTDIAPGMIGKHVNAGAVIARTLSTPRGNATQPGWLEFGDAALLGKGGETGGSAIAHELHEASHHSSSHGGVLSVSQLANSLPGGGAVVAGAAAAANAAGADVGGVVADTESAVAGKLVDALAGAFGAHAARIGLYVALIAGGLVLAVVGLSRAAGVTAGDVKTGAKLGAAVA
jgi:hypothetical protein